MVVVGGLMTTMYHAPLDVYFWFQSVMSGHIETFIFIFLIGVLTLGAIFRMPNVILITCISLFAVMFSTLFAGWLLVIGIFTAIVLGYWITRIFR